jgi:four helix bundle protein
MNRDEMRSRTKQFALRIIRLSCALPRTREGDVLGRQVLKSGTSVGANYRESLRASSRRHFVTILETALREADEADYWLELLTESGLVKASRLGPLARECRELVAILSATVRTTKRRMSKPTPGVRAKSQIPNPKSQIE